VIRTRRAAARIAVTGAGPSDGAARAFLRAELDGVRYEPFAAESEVDGALRDADMLVFVAGAGEQVDEMRTHAVASAARGRGILVAAIVLDTGASDLQTRLLASFREAADMVMVVRDSQDAYAIVAALR